MPKEASNKGRWSERTSFDEVCRRAAGRRHYNSVRRFQAVVRRGEVARLLRVQGEFVRRGVQADIARKLGVSRATICRDIAFLLRRSKPCPCCGALWIPLPADLDADAAAEPAHQ